MYIKTLKVLASLIVALLIIFVVFRVIVAVTPPASSISVDQTAVIKEIQALNKIETASFTIEKIIEGGSEGNAFQKILFGDKILLIAHGSVVAGFDLSKIKAEDVTAEGKKLTVKLPAPEILYSRLDNSQTKVYDRKLGLLTKGSTTLEADARLAAEQSIREAACVGGIFDQAVVNVKQQLAILFLSLGFSEVVFDIPGAVCK
ncbi:MAG: DUF4230 domain-containing protein [Patescibacteria group bacterium]